jgi:dTDP-4-dehydrorhamnose reductase
MRYLITGAGGMLGHDLVEALYGRDVTPLTRAELDITDLEAVRAAVVGFDVILNTAAYTRVDDAESHEADAWAINAVGAGNVATAASDVGAVLVQYSTDYVFDGAASRPYPEDAPIAPVTAYGRTKAGGERLVREANPDRTIIIRTAWLYGQHGPNFATTMLRLASDRPEVTVITDQVGQPTWTADLARQTASLLDAGVTSGTFHGTNSGKGSWFDFARAVFAEAGLDAGRVKPTDSTQFVRPAPRPPYSVLGHDAWTVVDIPPMRGWEDALHEAFASGAITAP